MNKIHIIPHCDIQVRNEQLYIPTIQSKTLNIGFVGTFNEYKGGRLFLDLIYNLLTYKNYKIEYHIFGKHTQSDHDNKLKDYNKPVVVKVCDNDNYHLHIELNILKSVVVML